VLPLGAVGGGEPFEVVAFHRPRKTFALRDTDDIYGLARLEHVGPDLGAERIVTHVFEPKLHEVAGGVDSGFCVMARQRFVGPLRGTEG
jgi:hypothetical protein